MWCKKRKIRSPRSSHQKNLFYIVLQIKSNEISFFSSGRLIESRGKISHIVTLSVVLSLSSARSVLDPSKRGCSGTTQVVVILDECTRPSSRANWKACVTGSHISDHDTLLLFFLLSFLFLTIVLRSSFCLYSIPNGLYFEGF